MDEVEVAEEVAAAVPSAGKFLLVAFRLSEI